MLSLALIIVLSVSVYGAELILLKDENVYVLINKVKDKIKA